MQKLLITAICIIFLCRANAQTDKKSLQNPAEYFNNALTYLGVEPNADSAFYFIKKISLNDKYNLLLKMLLHNNFAQEFMQKEIGDTISSNKPSVSREVLNKINSDTTKLLLETIRPMTLWIKIQDNRNNLPFLRSLTDEFIKTQLSSKDIYSNLSGRYGLMIYQLISAHKELKILAEKLHAIIYTNLKNTQIVATDTSSRASLDKRAWYRYMFAYINCQKAQQTQNSSKKESYLKTAFNYSPDITDQNHKSSYFYDMLFLNEERQSFKNDYLTFLLKTPTNKSKLLSILLKIALNEPVYKFQLEQFYNNNKMASKKFSVYWMDAINANAKIAPPISLQQLDNKLFSSKQHFNKWLLVDFWGTWCAPCRKEHPELQKFYDSIVSNNAKSIYFITVACKDTRQKVSTYLAENNYSFPVAMSDDKIEKTYSIQGYPSKILITPAGKYIVIPFGIDWVNFVKQYCNL